MTDKQAERLEILARLDELDRMKSCTDRTGETLAAYRRTQKGA